MDSPYYDTDSQHPSTTSQLPFSFMIPKGQLYQSSNAIGDGLVKGRNITTRFRVRSVPSDSTQDDDLASKTRRGAFIEYRSKRVSTKIRGQAPIVFIQLRMPHKRPYPSSTRDRSPLNHIPDFEIVSGVQITDQATLLNNQVKMVDYSGQEEEVHKVMSSHIVFIDVSFAPGDKTILGEMMSHQDRFAERKERLVWRRLSEVVWNAGLFTGGIHPNNVHQGQFGTAYLLISLSAIAERPQRIRDLFLSRQMYQEGVFSCSLLFRGRRKSLYLDSFFPLPREEYAEDIYGCSIGRLNQLWVSVVEKAWAKLYGSYYAIEGGQIEETLHDLTGAHLRFIRTKDPDFDKLNCWSILLEATKLGYVMIAQATPQKYDGMSFAQQYAVLGVYEITHLNKPVQIVKCRNPWNHEKYGFDWSKSDTRWSAVSELDLKKVGYKRLLETDFLLPFKDFIRWFTKITIAEIVDSASYVYCSQPATSCEPRYFKVNIFKEGWYSLQLNQTPSKILLKGKRQPFSYLPARMSIARIMPNGELQWWRGAQSAHRTVFRKLTLPQGQYIVCTDLEFYNQDTYKEATLAVYGQHCCGVMVAPQSVTINFHRKLFLSHAQQASHLIGKDIFEANEVLEEGYIYTAVLNRTLNHVQVAVEYIFYQYRPYDNLNPSVEPVEGGSHTIGPMNNLLIYKKVPTCGVETTKLCGIRLIQK